MGLTAAVAAVDRFTKQEKKYIEKSKTKSSLESSSGSSSRSRSSNGIVSENHSSNSQLSALLTDEVIEKLTVIKDMMADESSSRASAKNEASDKIVATSMKSPVEKRKAPESDTSKGTENPKKKIK